MPALTPYPYTIKGLAPSQLRIVRAIPSSMENCVLSTFSVSTCVDPSILGHLVVLLLTNYSIPVLTTVWGIMPKLL